jgi:hypothetical protein
MSPSASRLHGLAPSLTVFEKFADVQMIGVHIPTTDGRELQLTRYTQPEQDLMLVLQRIKFDLPETAATGNHRGSGHRSSLAVVPTFGGWLR